MNFHESCLSRELQNMASRRNGAENTNKLLQIFVQIETFTTTFAPTQNTKYKQFVTLALKTVEKSTKLSHLNFYAKKSIFKLELQTLPKI